VFKVLAKGESISIHDSTSDNIYETKYGPLKIVRNTFLSNAQLRSMRTIHYLVNGVGANFVRKVLKGERDALMVFDC
jgi:hypothetical protein